MTGGVENMGKLIAVSGESGYTSFILKNILTFCGRENCRVAPADAEPLPAEQPAVLLLCGGRDFEAAKRFSRCVADYADAGRPELAGVPLLTYSLQSDSADFTARNIRSAPAGGVSFEVVGVGVIGRVRLSCGGEELAEPVLAATAAAIAAGVPFAVALDAVNRIPCGEENRKAAAP